MPWPLLQGLGFRQGWPLRAGRGCAIKGPSSLCPPRDGARARVTSVSFPPNFNIRFIYYADYH